MLAAKFYALLWALVIAAAGAVYVAGWFSPTVLVIFGFISATLVFMGVIAVLPSVVNHQFSPEKEGEDFKTKYKFTAPEQHIYR